MPSTYSYFAGSGFIARVPPSRPRSASSGTTGTTAAMPRVPRRDSLSSLNSTTSLKSKDSVDSINWEKQQHQQQPQEARTSLRSRLGLRTAVLRAVRRVSGSGKEKESIKGPCDVYVVGGHVALFPRGEQK
ncbi:hypothetical protein SVAN01_11329 [Stagonosporopsis vannaccii]|nr:hypothetical protein SVAN01_11329 [Stagonosporopsis vannaccii]